MGIEIFPSYLYFLDLGLIVMIIFLGYLRVSSKKDYWIPMLFLYPPVAVIVALFFHIVINGIINGFWYWWLLNPFNTLSLIYSIPALIITYFVSGLVMVIFKIVNKFR